MLDINLIRKDPDYVKAQLAKREYEVDFTELLAWDARRRELIAENEAMKAERNRINKEIPRIKKEGGDMAPLMAKMKEMSESVKRMDEEQRDLEEKIETFEQRYVEEFGEHARLCPGNVISTKRLEVKTPEVVVKVSPDRSDLVETRTIDGVKYILIRAETGVEVNGVDVDIK